MDTHTSVWYDIIETARWAPTPHNTQAYRLKIVDEETAYLYAKNSRLIPATDPEGQFLYVGLGIFIEIMRLCAAEQGYTLTHRPDPTNSRDGLRSMGSLSLKKSAVGPDIDTSLIKLRRTSRLPFDGIPITDNAKQELEKESQRYGQELGFSDDPMDVASVLRFNTKILFYDLNHTDLRRELVTWIRWSDKEYTRKRDGFSIPSLNQNTTLMWVFLHSYWVLRLPLVRGWVRRRYERAISNVGTIGWIKGPFKTDRDWVKAGELLARLWLKATAHKLYLHPFGSVITNQEARQWALDQLHLEEAPNEMCWLLFRIGTGPTPPRSLRKHAEEYFV